MYQPDSEDEIEGFAQSQSAFYEQFLEVFAVHHALC